MKFHTFFGVRFLKATYIECLDIISSRLKNKEQTLIVTPNPEILYDAYNDKKLAAILRSSDIAIPDGVGIFVGYQIADSKLPRWIKY
jgi:N-acetylglucosaminyldiphosphoundecaprenol N-acetyl-beta-D-mannosaminyltransferase